MRRDDSSAVAIGLRSEGFTIAAQSGSADLASSEQWKQTLDAVDEVIVICGLFTGKSAAVNAQLRAVQKSEKPYFLLWGRRELMCRKPQASRPRDSMYSWTPQIIAMQVQETLRHARFSADPAPRAAATPPAPAPAPEPQSA